MEAYQFDAYGEAITLHEHATPTPTGNEVLVKIASCGVCHSDVHLWEGYFDLGGERKLDTTGARKLPFTLGHEIIGEVVAIGDQVTGAAVGDKRVVYPWIGCGECEICQAGDEHICNSPLALGVNVDGGFADHVLVPDAKYLFDYGDTPVELACTYACSGITAYGALMKVKDLVAGKHLLIVGAGGVGMNGIMIAQAALDTEIIVADIDPAALEAAKAAGAHHVVNPMDKDSGKQVFKLTGGGAPGVVDFVGNEASTRFATGAVGKSGTVAVVGLMGGALSLAIPMITLKNMTICGSYLGSLAEMGDLMALVRAGKLKPIPITPRPMDQVQATVEDLRDGKIVGRVVVQP